MDSNRVMKLAAVVGAAGTVALAGFGLFYPTPEDSSQYLGWRRGGEAVFPPREAPELTPDEHAEALAPALKGEVAEERQAAREALFALLDDGTPLGEAAQETVASALIEAHQGSSGTTKSEIAERKQCLELLVASVKGDAARGYAEQVLATGDDADKAAIAAALTKPGAMRGGTLYEKAYELTKTAAIPETLKPAVIRRIRGKKAEEELMAVVRETKDKKVLAAAAVEVQNLNKPELLGDVIARLDEMGMIQDKSMPWFSGKLLSAHIKKSDGIQLVRALKVVWTRPSLTKTTFNSVQDTLASADPAVRRMAAHLVPDAVKYAALEAAEGEKTLSARLAVETDPAVKGELEAGLGEVRKNRRDADPVVPAEQMPQQAPQAVPAPANP